MLIYEITKKRVIGFFENILYSKFFRNFFKKIYVCTHDNLDY
jgi:hypothetical protein